MKWKWNINEVEFEDKEKASVSFKNKKSLSNTEIAAWWHMELLVIEQQQYPPIQNRHVGYLVNSTLVAECIERTLIIESYVSLTFLSTTNPWVVYRSLFAN